jgi:hypothetical protein
VMSPVGRLTSNWPDGPDWQRCGFRSKRVRESEEADAVPGGPPGRRGCRPAEPGPRAPGPAAAGEMSRPANQS